MIAHDFAETYGGAERVTATVAAMLPGAEVWTILGRPSVAQRMGVADRFHSILSPRPALLRHYRALTPIYPALVRRHTLPEADVLFTSSYAFAHGFRTENSAPQVCYCYSPLRFAWSMTDAYAAQVRIPGARAGIPALAALMRSVDRREARRVSRYIAESNHVAAQIREYYGVESTVIMPPVDCSHFVPPAEPGHDDYFLFCSRLIEPYKRPFMAVEAFRDLPYRLVIASDGPALSELQKVAPPNVEFVLPANDSELVGLMQRCAAVVFPSLDDFGLIPVEVMACGRPVIAFGAGGALETVEAGRTGEFFSEQSVASLRGAIESFDPDSYDSAAIRRHAEAWDVARFQARILRVIDEVAGRG